MQGRRQAAWRWRHGSGSRCRCGSLGGGTRWVGASVVVAEPSRERERISMSMGDRGKDSSSGHIVKIRTLMSVFWHTPPRAYSESAAGKAAVNIWKVVSSEQTEKPHFDNIGIYSAIFVIFQAVMPGMTMIQNKAVGSFASIIRRSNKLSVYAVAVRLQNRALLLP